MSERRSVAFPPRPLFFVYQREESLVTSAFHVFGQVAPIAFPHCLFRSKIHSAVPIPMSARFGMRIYKY
jgi:hypothetical protein